MYREFYGLRAKPFQKTPDPRFLYMSRAHEEALWRRGR
jgi:general secretion pathway protein A